MTNKKVSFWRIFWPSLISGIVLLIGFFMLFAGLIGSLFNAKPIYSVQNKTVLHLELNDEIAEMSRNDISFSNFGMVNQVGLADLLYGFEKAAKDDRIEGVFIELKRAYCGYSTATEIRNAIKKFEEESGKFVVAYHSGEAVSLKQYYIASAASENYRFHSSMFEFLGLGAELMFYKGLFDKIDLEMQVIRGSNNDFKSAVEPYFLTEMSDSSRLQLETYMNNIWTAVKTGISEDKNLTMQELEMIADSSLVRRVQQARSEEHTSELQSRPHLVCRLLLEKKKLRPAMSRARATALVTQMLSGDTPPAMVLRSCCWLSNP